MQNFISTSDYNENLSIFNFKKISPILFFVGVHVIFLSSFIFFWLGAIVTLALPLVFLPVVLIMMILGIKRNSHSGLLAEVSNSAMNIANTKWDTFGMFFAVIGPFFLVFLFSRWLYLRVNNNLSLLYNVFSQSLLFVIFLFFILFTGVLKNTQFALLPAVYVAVILISIVNGVFFHTKRVEKTAL